MKYLPRVHLDNTMVTALERGQLLLQPGQWVRFDSGVESRWIGLAPHGGLWLCHGHNGRHDEAKFRYKRAAFRWAYPQVR